MKEVIRHNDQTPLTNLLNADKPYLVLDTNTGQFHIQWWRVYYCHGDQNGNWQGSDWTDAKGKRLTADTQANSFPKRCRIFKLPTVKYERAKKIVKC